MLVSAIHQHESAIVYSLNHVQLCDPMDCSTPGFSVLHYPPEFAQTHVHWVNWCHPTTSSSVTPFSCLQSLPASGSFPMCWLFASSGQSIGASASVLPMSIQYSFRMDWLDRLAVQGTLKSLLQHHSSEASILQCAAFFMVQFSHPYMTIGKTIALIIWTFVEKVMSLLFIYCLGLSLLFFQGVRVF